MQFVSVGRLQTKIHGIPLATLVLRIPLVFIVPRIPYEVLRCENEIPSRQSRISSMNSISSGEVRKTVRGCVSSQVGRIETQLSIDMSNKTIIEHERWKIEIRYYKPTICLLLALII